MDYLFHGSNIQHLETLVPQYSGLLHKNVLYATTDFYIASLFLNKTGGDYFCSLLLRGAGGPPFIIERVRNGIQYRFQGKKGSIYLLKKNGFHAVEGGWRGEVMSEYAVQPIEEIRVDDVPKYIEDLVELGKIIFVPFDKRHEYISDDDNDLRQLFKKELASQSQNQKLLDLVRSHHPHIYHDYAH
ncbi:hypothetical protein [Chitinophaga flava]|uniref:Uncharacterized protein n=1 Tax=Chitinophaga flava TaxID=2259036 RepID=A0A365XUE3_9BACT|nr:hypothetical protein [Chitinophaga flava]RBL89641.1 hypothetical protein DF182_24380 [Chitinophaga flava]